LSLGSGTVREHAGTFKIESLAVSHTRFVNGLTAEASRGSVMSLPAGTSVEVRLSIRREVGADVAAA